MPVRRIPPSRRAITGRLAASKSVGFAHYESALERDFLITLEVDVTVQSFEVQPLRLDYVDSNGHKRHYTPDVLVKRQHITELCEVKYASDIQALRAVHKERWLVAHRYAVERGWAFRLITEYHARHPRSRNWLFLSPFRTLVFPAEKLSMAQGVLGASASITVRDWLARLPEPSADWLGVIWHLVATEQVLTDLRLPLTLDAVLYTAPLAPLASAGDLL